MAHFSLTSSSCVLILSSWGRLNWDTGTAEDIADPHNYKCSTAKKLLRTCAIISIKIVASPGCLDFLHAHASKLANKTRVRGGSVLDDGWFQLLLCLQPWAAVCVPYLLRQRRDIRWAHSGCHIPRQIRKYVRLAEKCWVYMYLWPAICSKYLPS